MVVVCFFAALALRSVRPNGSRSNKRAGPSDAPRVSSTSMRISTRVSSSRVRVPSPCCAVPVSYFLKGNPLAPITPSQSSAAAREPKSPKSLAPSFDNGAPLPSSAFATPAAAYAIAAHGGRCGAVCAMSDAGRAQPWNPAKSVVARRHARRVARASSADVVWFVSTSNPFPLSHSEKGKRNRCATTFSFRRFCLIPPNARCTFSSCFSSNAATCASGATEDGRFWPSLWPPTRV
mmetsp:Transcript_2036/g.7039  ORF Transcript_2036/g.7039 Transcript_2036/m.7039 type:complete len:235 (-) Transcript_2036:840-1544(-)